MSLEQVLNAREVRVNKINELIKQHQCVISLRSNYPGSNKDNWHTRYLTRYFADLFTKQYAFVEVDAFNYGEGPVRLFTSEEIGEDVKRKLIDLEDHHPLGRFIDCDVYTNSSQSLSRKSLGSSGRNCFLCERDAFICIRAGNHGIEELQTYFKTEVEGFFREAIALKLSEFTLEAMGYELMASPAFGLVTPYTSGAHRDMDHYTFVKSMAAINKYFYHYAKLGFQAQNLEALYNEAVRIGCEAEREMFQKTAGVNTHKGLIYVLGTLVLATSKAIYDEGDFEHIFAYAKMVGQLKFKELEHLKQKPSLSNGEKIYLRHKITGVRGEASQGFPSLQAVLPLIDLDKPDSFVNALIYLMSEIDDTTIINRHGMEVLNEVKTRMKQIYQHQTFNLEELKKIEREFIERNISPGGAADLLCGAIYLKLVQNLFNQIR